MTHPLVDQLRFARSELERCLAGVSGADARRRLEPMNCISWIVGHLAAQEQKYWVTWAQDRELIEGLQESMGYGCAPSAPPLDEMWNVWRQVTATADAYLDTLKPEVLQTHFEWRGQPIGESVGTLLLRNIYHYWFHTGEAHAIRQMLGHPDLPQFVGDVTQVKYQSGK
jgi:hypothetical protein